MLTRAASREDTRLDRTSLAPCDLSTPIPQHPNIASPLITVEIVYALPGQQALLSLSVAEGTTVAAVLDRPELAALHPDLAWREHRVGIFGQLVDFDHVLSDGDRIEIYRPLIADPNASRQARVEKRRAERGDGRKMRA